MKVTDASACSPTEFGGIKDNFVHGIHAQDFSKIAEALNFHMSPEAPEEAGFRNFGLKQNLHKNISWLNNIGQHDSFQQQSNGYDFVQGIEVLNGPVDEDAGFNLSDIPPISFARANQGKKN